VILRRTYGDIIDWILGGVVKIKAKSLLIFLNETHFILYIFVADLKSFSKHYNEVIFRKVLFEL